MSDDKAKGKSPSIPPELKPYMGQKPVTEVVLRDSAEVAADFAEIEAAVAEWTRKAAADDAKLGVGNVSAYVAPVAVPGGGSARAGTGEAAPPKVALAVADEPRSLPEGRPSAPTQEINTRALRANAGEPATAMAATRKGGEGGRAGGGNTERMPVVARGDDGTDEPKPASPWTKDAVAAVRSGALPSSLGPREAGVSGGEKAAGDALRDRRRGMGAIGVALVVVALVIGARALTTAGTPENGGQGPAPAASPTATAGALTVGPVTAPAPPASVVAVPPPASASSAGAALPPSMATAQPRPHPVPAARASSVVEDPYDVAVKPVTAATAVPSTAPAVTAAPAAAVPKAPATAPSARPAPVSTSGRIVGGEE